MSSRPWSLSYKLELLAVVALVTVVVVYAHRAVRSSLLGELGVSTLVAAREVAEPPHPPGSVPVDLVPADRLLDQPEAGFIVDEAGDRAIAVVVVGASDEHLYLDIEGQRLDSQLGWFEGGNQLLRVPQGSTAVRLRRSLAAGSYGPAWGRSSWSILHLAAILASVLFTAFGWIFLPAALDKSARRPGFGWKSLKRRRRFFTALASGALVAGILALGCVILMTGQTLGRSIDQVARLAPTSAAGVIDELLNLGATLGLCAAVPLGVWAFRVSQSLKWPVFAEITAQLRDGEERPQPVGEGALTLGHRDLLECAAVAAELDEQLVRAGVRPGQASPSDESDVEGGGDNAARNLVVAHRLADLVEAGLVEFRNESLALTPDGHQKLEEPRALFATYLPLGSRRALIEAEQRLRQGDGEGAILGAATVLEAVLKRWVARALNELGRAEAEGSNGRPIDSWEIGPLVRQLEKVVMGGAEAARVRSATVATMPKKRRTRLVGLLDVARQLRNKYAHDNQDRAVEPRSITLREARTMLDVVRTSIGLGEEYLSAAEAADA